MRECILGEAERGNDYSRLMEAAFDSATKLPPTGDTSQAMTTAKEVLKYEGPEREKAFQFQARYESLIKNGQYTVNQLGTLEQYIDANLRPLGHGVRK